MLFQENESCDFLSSVSYRQYLNVKYKRRYVLLVAPTTEYHGWFYLSSKPGVRVGQQT